MNRHPLRPFVKPCVLLLAGLAASCAQADSITLPSNHDTTIFADYPNNSLGGGVAMFAGTNSSSSLYARRSLMSFDFSAIPAGSIINSVQLHMYLAGVSGGLPAAVPTTSVELHKLTADWGEGTALLGQGPGGTGSGAAAGAGDATYAYRHYNTDSWAMPGGDFVATASATQTVGYVTGDEYIWSSPQMVADVQDWVDHGNSYGWLLKADESEKNTFRQLYSREATLVPSYAQYYPRLTVDYTPVPEPSTLALFGIGAVTLLACTWRRWRVRK